jgi:hypothetical protein
MVTDWEMLIERPGFTYIRVGEVEMKPGDRVRLHPMGQLDLVDSALEGKTAIIESIEEDFENRTYLVVTIDDANWVSGARHNPPHHFFFSVEEVELLPG